MRWRHLVVLEDSAGTKTAFGIKMSGAHLTLPSLVQATLRFYLIVDTDSQLDSPSSFFPSLFHPLLCSQSGCFKVVNLCQFCLNHPIITVLMIKLNPLTWFMKPSKI